MFPDEVSKMKSTADASVYLVGFKLETAKSLIARKEIF
jgi:hypothetical protein